MKPGCSTSPHEPAGGIYKEYAESPLVTIRTVAKSIEVRY